MTGTKFWRGLEARFRRLHDQQLKASHNDALHATWSCDLPDGERWCLGGATEDIRTQFEWVAESAAVRLGNPGGRNSFFRWLVLLRGESPHYHPFNSSHLVEGKQTNYESGIIELVCKASAEYCLKCETQEQIKTRTATRDAAPAEKWPAESLFRLDNPKLFSRVTTDKGEWLGVYKGVGGEHLTRVCAGRSTSALLRSITRLGLRWPLWVGRSRSIGGLPLVPSADPRGLNRAMRSAFEKVNAGYERAIDRYGEDIGLGTLEGESEKSQRVPRPLKPDTLERFCHRILMKCRALTGSEGRT